MELSSNKRASVTARSSTATWTSSISSGFGSVRDFTVSFVFWPGALRSEESMTARGGGGLPSTDTMAEPASSPARDPGVAGATLERKRPSSRTPRVRPREGR